MIDMNPQTLSTGAQLTPFLLEKPAEIGILIIPGGGYGHLAIGHEGHDIGAWLNARGYDAWMLEYHIADEKKAPLGEKPLHDAQAALATIRQTNRNQKLGVWGFSAGGHLAASLLTEPNVALDFGVLAYPVIDMAGVSKHGGSQRNLLGENPAPEVAERWSIQNQISQKTPPIFLFHTAEDGAVPVENSLMMAQKLAAHQIPFELHVYENGRHGVGLAPDDKILSTWSARLEDWLKQRSTPNS